MFIPLNRVFLLFGTACNLRCEYCLQHDIHEKQLPADIEDSVLIWIKQQAMRQARKRLNVTFYGGEPLLCWDGIKKAVLALEGVTGFSLITNGKLLDEEKVAYCNQHRIHITLSWDGANTIKTRHYDVLAEKRDLLLQADRLSISAVASSLVYPKDFCEEVEPFRRAYWESKRQNLAINIDTIMDFCGNCAELIKVDLAKLRSQSQAIAEAYARKEYSPAEYRPAEVMLAESIYRRANGHRLNGDNLSASCGNGVTVQNVDLQGNLYRCHNTQERIGSIRDSDMHIIKAGLAADPTARNAAAMCNACPVQDYCKNGCPIISQEDRRAYYCAIKRAYFEPFAEHARA